MNDYERFLALVKIAQEATGQNGLDARTRLNRMKVDRIKALRSRLVGQTTPSVQTNSDGTVSKRWSGLVRGGQVVDTRPSIPTQTPIPNTLPNGRTGSRTIQSNSSTKSSVNIPPNATPRSMGWDPMPGYDQTRAQWDANIKKLMDEGNAVKEQLKPRTTTYKVDYRNLLK